MNEIFITVASKLNVSGYVDFKANIFLVKVKKP